MARETWRALRRGLWGAVAVLAVGIALRAWLASRTPPPLVLSPTTAASALEASVPPSLAGGVPGRVPGQGEAVSVALPTARGWMPLRHWRGRALIVALAPTRPATKVAATLYHEWVQKTARGRPAGTAFVMAAPGSSSRAARWRSVWRAFYVSPAAVVPTVVVVDGAGRVRFVDVMATPGLSAVRLLARQAALATGPKRREAQHEAG